MDDKRKGGFKPDQIPDDFREDTNETRVRLEEAAKKDAPLVELITEHAEALKENLAILAKFCKYSRPARPSEFRSFIRDEADAIWYIQETVNGDIMLIRRLAPRLETSMAPKIREEWRNTLNQVDATIGASMNVVRASLIDLWDDNKNGDDIVPAWQRAIDTLDELAKQCSAIATTLVTVKKVSRGKAS